MYGHLQSSCSDINYTAMVTSLNVFAPLSQPFSGISEQDTRQAL